MRLFMWICNGPAALRFFPDCLKSSDLRIMSASFRTLVLTSSGIWSRQPWRCFLRTYYKRVPFASLAWVIARVDPKMSAGELPQLPVEHGQLLQSPAVVVASARLIRALHVRAEAFTASADEAQGLTEKLNALLALVRFSEVETPSGGPDADVKAFFESLRVSQEKDRSVLTATMPLGFVRKVFRDPAAETEEGTLTGTTPQEAERKLSPKATAAR